MSIRKYPTGRSLCSGLLASTMLMVAAAPVLAQASRQRFDIPAQAAGDALNTFSKQSGLRLLFPYELVAGKQTQSISGELTVEEALQKLLAGSNLTYEITSSGTLLIRATDEGNSSSAASASKETTSKLQSSESAGRGVPLAVADALAQDGAGNDQTSRQDADNARRIELEEILVTGTRIARRTVEGPRQLKVYSREDIEASGQSTVSGFLNTRSEVSTASTETVGSGVQFSQSGVRLRGLPAGSTLVLINGRRVQRSGPTFLVGGMLDLNLIPAAAVERIEVLPESASATYGSDALAGVVNVILRKMPGGLELDARYGYASGSDETAGSFAWGHSWERGAVSLMGTYYEREELSGTERSITADKNWTRFGGPDLRDVTCNPGNVRSISGNLPGLSAPQAAIPAGISGTPTTSDFAATAGRINRCSTIAELAMIPETHRWGVLASAHYDLTPSLNVFAEFLYSQVEQFSRSRHRTLANVLLPASNVFNPFGVDVRVDYEFLDPVLRLGNDSDIDFIRPLLGAAGPIAGTWRWELAAWQARDRNENTVLGLTQNTANLNAALASADPATALNLFTSGAAGSPEILRSLWSPQVQSFEGELGSATAQVGGELFDLPAGAVDVVLGAEYNEETQTGARASALFTTLFTFRTHSSAAFLEARVPVVAGNNGDAGEALVLTAAARYDQHADFGNKTSPQLGIEWRPTSTLLLRAGYAEAFRAPGLFQLFQPRETFPNSTFVDPRRGGETRLATVTRAGNPNLGPETGDSISAGLVWTSAAIDNLQLSLSAWQIRLEERVTAIGSQAIVNNEALFPGRVQRGPDEAGGVPGPIIQVDDSPVNFGLIEVAGLDAAVTYRWQSPWGEWSPSLSATYTDRFRIQVVPGGVVTDQAGKASTLSWAPRLKGQLSLGWKRGPFALTAAGRYVDSYLDYQDFAANTRELDDFWLFDLNAKVDVNDLFSLGAGMPETQLSLGLSNAFDSEPQFSDYRFSTLGYDPTQADIRGRFAYLNLRVNW